MMRYYYWGYPMMGSGWGIVGFIASIIFWVLIIGLVIFIIRRIAWSGPYYGHHGHRHGRMALEVLKTRYAKGEISKEEYQKMKKELTED